MNPYFTQSYSYRLVTIARFAWPVLVCPLGAAELSIGVNFSEASTQLLSTDSAGAPGYVQTNWNNLGPTGGPVAINDGTGSVTPIEIRWESGGFWRDGNNPATTTDQKLMKEYLDSNGQVNGTFNGFVSDDDEPIILLSGLDSWMSANGLTSYSIVLYSDGDDTTGERAAKLWLASTSGTLPDGVTPGLGSDLTVRRDLFDVGSFGATETYTEVTGTEGTGNFTVFEGLIAGSLYVRTEEAGPAAFRAPINAIQIVGSDAVVVDSDNDGLPDFWEISWGFDPNDDGSILVENGPGGDPDMDNRSNLQEYNGGINGTNPQKADTDDDELDDGEEFTAGTDPLDPDSDDDTLPDGWEVKYSLDPLDDGTVNEVNGALGDPDGDFSENDLEYFYGTNPRDEDTDDDGYSDFAEDNFDDWVNTDFTGTDPLRSDSDSDGFPDGAENPDVAHVPGSTLGTDPNKGDSDGDGVNDRWEVVLGLDPSNAASGLTEVAVQNGSFEEQQTTEFVYEVPIGWTLENATEGGQFFIENIDSVGVKGGDGANYFGIQAANAVLSQDTGVAFLANTTYVFDLEGVYRTGFGDGELPGLIEFGLYSSDDVGTTLGNDPGMIDSGGVVTASGNPDADDFTNRLRAASILSNLGSGQLGQAYSFVTGDNPPTGNIVVYVRLAGGDRIIFDNVRLFAVPNSLDGDGDNLPDVWELANRLDPQDSTGINGEEGDFDGDGFSNAAELAAGTNPANAASLPVVAPPVIVSSSFNGAAFEVVVTNLDVSSTYTLARGVSLQDFTPIGDTVTGVSGGTFVDPAPPVGKAFYRIQNAPEEF